MRPIPGMVGDHGLDLGREAEVVEVLPGVPLPDDGAIGQRLRMSEGRAGNRRPPTGTELVADINFSSEGSDPLGLTVVNGELFFAAYDDLAGQVGVRNLGARARLDSRSGEALCESPIQIDPNLTKSR